MKVLLTGSKGQLGSCFQDRLPEGWQVWATDADVLDITDLEKVKAAVAEFQPDAIVNAAAYTAVDKAEQDRELAALINVVGPKNLALAAKDAGARLVHAKVQPVTVAGIKGDVTIEHWNLDTEKKGDISKGISLDDKPIAIYTNEKPDWKTVKGQYFSSNLPQMAASYAPMPNDK